MLVFRPGDGYSSFESSESGAQWKPPPWPFEKASPQSIIILASAKPGLTLHCGAQQPRLGSVNRAIGHKARLHNLDGPAGMIFAPQTPNPPSAFGRHLRTIAMAACRSLSGIEMAARPSKLTLARPCTQLSLSLSLPLVQLLRSDDGVKLC